MKEGPPFRSERDKRLCPMRLMTYLNGLLLTLTNRLCWKITHSRVPNMASLEPPFAQVKWAIKTGMQTIQIFSAGARGLRFPRDVSRNRRSESRWQDATRRLVCRFGVLCPATVYQIYDRRWRKDFDVFEDRM